MSKLALVGLIAGTMLSQVAPAGAWSLFGDPLDTAPWCVVYDIGAGVVHENCSMPSYQACNAERILQGRTAFCRPNAAFARYSGQPLQPEAQASAASRSSESNALLPAVRGPVRYSTPSSICPRLPPWQPCPAMTLPTASPRCGASTGSTRQRIGVLQAGYADSPFSLTEARVLYEIRERDRPTATDIGRDLDLDAGYLSRILRRFQKLGFIRKETSPADARQSLLSLTERGRKAFAPVEARSTRQVGAMLGTLTATQQGDLVAALHMAEALLAGKPQRSHKPSPEPILRQPRAGDFGWIVERHGILYAQEYGWGGNFEGVCAQIVADFVNTFDPQCERGWIAELDGRNVGCVLLVKDQPGVARLRLASGRAVGARPWHRRAPDRRMRPLRARLRLPQHDAMDPQRADRGAGRSTRGRALRSLRASKSKASARRSSASIGI